MTSKPDPVPTHYPLFLRAWWKFWKRYPRLVQKWKGYAIYQTLKPTPRSRWTAFCVHWVDEKGTSYSVEAFESVGDCIKYIEDRQ
jgi:hypothetical protein